MRCWVSLVFAAGAAYSFSFAADLLIGGIIGFFPATVFPAVITWSIIATLLLYMAYRIGIRNLRWLPLPYIAFGALATLGAVVGHVYSIGVAGLLFLHAYLIWKGTSVQAAPYMAIPNASAQIGSGGRDVPVEGLLNPSVLLQGGMQVNKLTPVKSHETRAEGSFQVGGYHLGASISGLTGLVEFSPNEYMIFSRSFKGEKNFHSPVVNFLEIPWQTDLGTVDGRIYKIAIYQTSDSRESATDALAEVRAYCWNRFGKPDQEPMKGTFIWDVIDGNIVIQSAKVANSFLVSVFETSSMVRTFAPMR